MTCDPYGTRALRSDVLRAWGANPARFREDANAEEDHAHGYYRDRVVTELAQNAADAAERAHVRGRLVLRLVPRDGAGLLVAANTGAPLDAGGVASLASLRASAKRGQGSVGRFGVGFAAVRSVADTVLVASEGGSVHFSVDAALELLSDGPEALRGEVARRGRSVPALRLPVEGPGPLDGVVAELAAVGAPWATVVVLALRDAAAYVEVARQLREVDDPLLVALPGLAGVEVEVDGQAREVADVHDRWVLATRTGRLSPELLAGLPVEDRERPSWQVTWAVRRADGAGSVARVVHAPTPTDEPCTVPALLVGTFPLDPGRRSVSPGPVTDELVGQAGRAWTDLLVACRGSGGPDPLGLVPSGLPSGTVDAALHEAVLAAAREAPILEGTGDGAPVAPSRAVALAGPAGESAALVGLLARARDGLVQVPPGHAATLARLGVEVVPLGDLLEVLPVGGPAELRALYEALAGLEGDLGEDLATVPVLLADGRVVRGGRGAVITEGLGAEVARGLRAHGVRVVHPDATHPLLVRLGAEPAERHQLARHPALRREVLEGDSEDGVAALLLALLEGSEGPAPGLSGGRRSDEPWPGEPRSGEPWWGEVLVEAEDGEVLPARGTTLPGTPAARWFDAEVLPAVGPDVVQRWGGVLAVLGVRTGLVVERVRADHVDTELVTGTLDGWAEYLAHLETCGADPDEHLAVADLDAVRDEAWADVLVALATGLPREALLGTGPTRRSQVLTYTAWWLRHRGGPVAGRPFALAGADAAVRALVPAPPAPVVALDRDVQRALGGVGRLEELDAGAWAAVLDGLPAAGTEVDPAVAVGLWRALAAYADHWDEVGGPAVDARVLPGLCADGVVRTVATSDLCVADPQWLQLDAVRPAVPAPGRSLDADDGHGAVRLADLLDLDLASDRSAGVVTSQGHQAPVPGLLREVLPGLPERWVEHEDLEVDGCPVDWWVDAVTGPEPAVHAATVQGLAQGLAAVTGWQHRHHIARVLDGAADRVAALLDLASEPPTRSQR